MLRFKKGSSHSEVPNYLASVSDLMCGLLFIFIITLAVAVLQARAAKQDAERQEQSAKQAKIYYENKINELNVLYEDKIQELNSLYEEKLEALNREKDSANQRTREMQTKLSTVESHLIGNDRSRRGLLENVQTNLAQGNNIHVNIDSARGVIRIPESAVTFAVGSAILDSSNAEKVNFIGSILQKELVCFTQTYLEAHPEECHDRNPNRSTLDAVFVEGHTDNQTYRGDTSGSRNLRLSTDRSNAVYQTLMRTHPQLASLTNDKGETLFSLSGYGAERPVPGHFHATPTDDPANRRIELRFILAEPKMTDEERMLIHMESDEGKGKL